MKNTILAFILAAALALAPCALGLAANDSHKTVVQAAVVSPLEEGDAAPAPDGDETGDPSENPDGGEDGEPDQPPAGEEGGDPSENPDGGEDEEQPEEPAVPMDTSVKANILGIVVLALAAVCAVLTLILSIYGKKKNAGKRKNA